MKKNYKLTTWLIAVLTLCAVPATKATAADWTDVTSRFITNPTFDSDDGSWTWTTSTGTAGIGSGNARFFSGNFDFYQTLSNLPKGHYRLSVQSFYRDGGNDEAWNAHQNNTESLDAYLYAGSNERQLVSIFSESLDYNAAGRSWTPDNVNWYPDGRDAASLAIEAGHYWNSLEFDLQATGSVTIGVKCDVNKNSNYCVIDNFRLEYDGDPDAIVNDGWADLTDFVIKSPAFDGNSADGWQWETDASCNIRVECMEFWQGTYHIWQQLTGLPQGQYRLSVQSYYRQGNNNDSYNAHQNGTENITAYMYAGNKRLTLASPYSYELPSWTDGCWTYQTGGWWDGGETHYFPNTMESAAVAFANGAYWNTMTFDANGSITIGLRNDNWVSDNWTIFDNFRLEYKVDAKATAINISLPTTDIMAGESAKATLDIQPANTLRWAKWTSSDESVATVSNDGTVTGVNPGTATITAKTIDGSSLSATTTVRVTVNPPTSASLVINEIMASNVDEFVSPAFNFDGWVELYNPSSTPVTLAGCYVSTDMQNLTAWRMPSTVGALPAHGHAVLWFDSNDIAPQNAPFKLDVDGGAIYISNQDGQLIAQQSYPASTERVSYARTTDGGSTWGLAAQATPGAPNATSAFATEQLAAPVADQPSQLFEGALTVSVDIPQGCTLRYTTDGKLPTLDYGETSSDGRFDISETTTLRLRLFRDGWLPSRVTSRSYIYKDNDYTLPVVAVVADPDFIYSSEIGVFATGPNGRPGNGRDEKCNWNMNWERPVNFSYLDSDGMQVFNQDADLEMCGGWSRAWTPHSFKLKGTKEMGGVKYLPYPFFEQKPYIRNRTLQIRNGGNDNNGRFVDPAIQYMVETSGFNVDCQSYQPVHEFINGEYMGVLNVREPNNKHFVEANYGWGDDEIDQFEMSPDSGYIQKCGTPDAYIRLVDELSPNAADEATYAEICKLLDIDEYANYMATEFYLGGTDWPQNNVKGFRNRQDGKFRFVLFDIDFAFNSNSPFTTFMGKEIYTFDQLRPASLGRITDQIRFVTLFRNLLQNDSFRKQFIDAFCIVGGSVLEASRATEIANRLQSVVSGPMNLDGNGWALNNSANNVKNSLSGRLNTAINYLRNFSPMQLSGVKMITANLSVSTGDNSGRLQLNGHDVPTATFKGRLFAPAVVKASAPEGYTFKGWQDNSGTIVSSSEEYDISSLNIATLTAVFEKLTDDSQLLKAIAMPIKVNEVNAAGTVYLGETWKRADWLELYNTTDTELDVRGLYLSDDSDQPLKYQIQQSAKIPAGGHLVVWADGLGTNALGGQARQIHTNFKLSNKNGQQVFAVSSAEFVENNAKFFNRHPELKTFVDGLTYTAHSGQQTVGRYPDGGRSLYLMEHPTIERTNTLTSADLLTGEDQSMMALLSEEFTLQLAKGWNWTSHCLATPIRPANLSAEATRIVGQQQECYKTTQGMSGTLTALDAGRLYKVLMNAADTYTASDVFCQPDMPITLLPGWNWVGYPANGTQTLAEALADFSAEQGDQLVGQDGFAVYTADGWKGTLSSVETGHGYMLYTRQAKTLTFARPAQALNFSRAASRGKTAIDYGVDKHAHPNVMGIIGALERDGQPVEPGRFTLLAYSADECRGASQWVDGQVFLTAYGEGGEALHYYAKDEQDGAVYNVSAGADNSVFAAGVFGTVQSPRVFSIGNSEAVSIDFATTASDTVEGYYNLGGMRMGNRAAALPSGVYIVKMGNGSHRKIYVK